MSYYGKTLGFFRASSYDANAQAYFTGAGITDSTEKDLYNAFVVGCKADGIYSKLNTFHPMLGSSLTTKRYNAINTSVHLLNATGSSVAKGILYNATSASISGLTLSANNCGFGVKASWDINLMAVGNSTTIADTDFASIEISRETSSYTAWAFSSPSSLPVTISNPLDNLLSIQTTSSPLFLNFEVDPIGEAASAGITRTIGLTYLEIGDVISTGDTPTISCCYTSLGLNGAEMGLLTSRINTLMTGLGR